MDAGNEGDVSQGEDPDAAEVDSGEGIADTGVGDVETEDASAEDVGAEDVGETDVGAEDVGEIDVGAEDVGETNGSVDCEDQTLLQDLPEWSLATDVIEGNESDPSKYTEVFTGDEFPGTSNSSHFYMPKDQYASMEFTVPSDLTIEQGAWNLAPITHSVDTYGAGLMLISLSECPGDVDPENFDNPACIRIFENIEGKHLTRWSTDPDSGRCILEPGETYFMNVLFVNSTEVEFPPQQSECGGAPNCGVYFQAMPGG